MNLLKDHKIAKLIQNKLNFMSVGGLKGLCLRLLAPPWSTSLLCIVGDLATEWSLAVAVSVGDRGKVICDK